MPEFAAFAPREGERDGTRTRRGVRVRPARHDDRSRLAEIAAAREGVSPDEVLGGLARAHEATREGRALLLVAERDGAIAGFGKAAFFTPAVGAPANSAPEGWYLTGVVVDPAHRRHGVGAALTVARLERLEALGARAVYYFANAQNRVSVDLHRAYGFEEVTRDFHHPGATFEGGVGILFMRGATARARLLDRVDHLVYAAPNLDRATDDLERRLGVRASEGGRHEGRGTRNRLIAVGPRAYLEIVAPDEGQPKPPASRWFGIDALREGRLVRWAAHARDLSGLAAEARAAGVDLGATTSGSRQRPDGVTLTWSFTDPSAASVGGAVPFFIDWGASPHPATTAAPGPRLIQLYAEHPDPDGAARSLAAVSLALPVARGPEPALVATFRTARGDVDLR